MSIKSFSLKTLAALATLAMIPSCGGGGGGGGGGIAAGFISTHVFASGAITILAKGLAMSQLYIAPQRKVDNQLVFSETVEYLDPVPADPNNGVEAEDANNTQPLFTSTTYHIDNQVVTHGKIGVVGGVNYNCTLYYSIVSDEPGVTDAAHSLGDNSMGCIEPQITDTESINNEDFVGALGLKMDSVTVVYKNDQTGQYEVQKVPIDSFQDMKLKFWLKFATKKMVVQTKILSTTTINANGDRDEDNGAEVVSAVECDYVIERH